MAIEKHPHCELIKAWADGFEIQYFCTYDKIWIDNKDPSWSSGIKYRIKPKSKILKFRVAMIKGYVTVKHPKIVYDFEYNKLESHSDFIEWISNEYSYEVDS